MASSAWQQIQDSYSKDLEAIRNVEGLDYAIFSEMGEKNAYAAREACYLKDELIKLHEAGVSLSPFYDVGKRNWTAFRELLSHAHEITELHHAGVFLLPILVMAQEDKNAYRNIIKNKDALVRFHQSPESYLPAATDEQKLFHELLRKFCEIKKQTGVTSGTTLLHIYHYPKVVEQGKDTAKAFIPKAAIANGKIGNANVSNVMLSGFLDTASATSLNSVCMRCNNGKVRAQRSTFLKSIEQGRERLNTASTVDR
jgi:hypothetical protein